jgi:hypothetical protein
MTMFLAASVRKRFSAAFFLPPDNLHKPFEHEAVVFGGEPDAFFEFGATGFL